MTTRNPKSVPGTIPALSLWQPWASLVVWGEKQYETRNWRTDYRGLVYIHAAKTWTREQSRFLQTHAFAARDIELRIPGAIQNNRDNPLEGIVGIIGIVNITDCCEICTADVMRCSQKEISYGDWTPGRYAIECSGVVVFAKPIPWRGQQGWFNVPVDIISDDAKEWAIKGLPEHVSKPLREES